MRAEQIVRLGPGGGPPGPSFRSTGGPPAWAGDPCSSAARQTRIYRVFEGYAGWRPVTGPGWRSPYAVALAWSQRRQLGRKRVLVGQLDLIELGMLVDTGALRPELVDRRHEVRADPELARFADADRRLSAAQQGLLREVVGRYPVDDGQVAPTRLADLPKRPRANWPGITIAACRNRRTSPRASP
jgi:hypothetical protein